MMVRPALVPRRASLRSAIAASSAGRPPAYAWNWADGLRLYKGPLGAGRWMPATLRFTGVLLALPDATHRIFASHEGAGLYGWRGATGGVTGGLSFFPGGIGGYVETSRYVFSADDVGRLFATYLTVEQGVGARLYMGAAEVGTRTAPVTVTDPGGSGRLVFGGYIGGGFINPYIGVHSLSLSPVVMTPAEIAADAAQVMGRRRGIVLPLLPGEDQRHVADDVETTSDWHDRIGSLTLTEFGDVSVSRMS